MMLSKKKTIKRETFKKLTTFIQNFHTPDNLGYFKFRKRFRV
jgi:hypothetical protein